MFDLEKLLGEVKKYYNMNVTWYEKKNEQLLKYYMGKRKLIRSA